MDKYTKLSLLYDFYGGLLTERQNEVMGLYHEENLSLREIAEDFGISRQGVHDTLKNAEISLNEYEEKLKLVEKLTKQKNAINEIHEQIEKLLEENSENSRLAKKLKLIKKIIDELNY